MKQQESPVLGGETVQVTYITRDCWIVPSLQQVAHRCSNCHENGSPHLRSPRKKYRTWVVIKRSKARGMTCFLGTVSANLGRYLFLEKGSMRASIWTGPRKDAGLGIKRIAENIRRRPGKRIPSSKKRYEGQWWRRRQQSRREHGSFQQEHCQEHVVRQKTVAFQYL